MTQPDDEYVLTHGQWQAVRPLFEDFDDEHKEETA
jgi:hypothetical protein